MSEFYGKKYWKDVGTFKLAITHGKLKMPWSHTVCPLVDGNSKIYLLSKRNYEPEKNYLNSKE